MRDERAVREAIIRLDDAWTQLVHKAASELRESGLAVPPVQALMLRMLDLWGPQRMSDLAVRMAISLGACTTLVDRAIEDGLIERERDEADRRVVWVRLSGRGREALAAMRQARAEIVVRQLRAQPPEDMEGLIASLHRAAEAILAEQRIAT